MASRTFLSAFRPAAALASRQTIVSRSIATTAALRHKEDTLHERQEDSNSSERHKQDLLKKQKDGQGHWKPELASNAEEAIKADRSGDEDIKSLQDRTKATAEETHKKGTSMRDGL
ncbi:hypothetical protein BKA67DRAFT_154259 [Truncatella angustata]|uniref:Mitochondrial carrier protein pet8 protein n=1 Tax=Truncatella angustata TaxID=152316 RepID=A0A9P8UQW4_9PEZI|nr:uncharacterized protein BKA67DRAFT_154259 [Truncatella angustata]KAH6656385.1 hypothetical protein BKA67DRAFT_154259 [Truncatella angustata]KAH8196633.1 hypothetical protein TruAng_009192 [Truncatella angustata]